jgi:hypothetical protein
VVLRLSSSTLTLRVRQSPTEGNPPAALAHYLKTVPGRKTDVLDCQWLQQLHTYGLLSGSFRPEDQICVLRSYIRQRDNLIKSGCVHIQRMQKALTQMNIQLHRVISSNWAPLV